MNCSKWLLLCVCYLQMRGRRSSRGRGRGRRRSESPPVGERARPRSRSPSQLEAVVRRRPRAGRSVPAASRVASAAPANTGDREVSPPPTFDSSSPLHGDVETVHQVQHNTSGPSTVPPAGYWQPGASNWVPWSINTPHTMPPPQSPHIVHSQPMPPFNFSQPPLPYQAYPYHGFGHHQPNT